MTGLTLEISGAMDWMSEHYYGECKCCGLLDSVSYDPHSDWMVCLECEIGECDRIDSHGYGVDCEGAQIVPLEEVPEWAREMIGHSG